MELFPEQMPTALLCQAGMNSVPSSAGEAAGQEQQGGHPVLLQRGSSLLLDQMEPTSQASPGVVGLEEQSLEQGREIS